MPARKKGILISDDKAVLRLGLRNILNDLPGWRVIGESWDGPSTISLARKLHPELIFIKMDLPFMDGIKATQQIKKRAPDIGVIMLLTDPSDFFRAVHSGADGYVLRDTPEHLISSCVDIVANHGAWVGPLVAQYLLHGDGLSVLRGAVVEQVNVPGFTKLTERERDVVRLLVQGLTNQNIADALALKVETVKSHMRSILKKLELDGRAEVISAVLKDGRLI